MFFSTILKAILSTKKKKKKQIEATLNLLKMLYRSYPKAILNQIEATLKAT